MLPVLAPSNRMKTLRPKKWQAKIEEVVEQIGATAAAGRGPQHQRRGRTVEISVSRTGWNRLVWKVVSIRARVDEVLSSVCPSNPIVAPTLIPSIRSLILRTAVPAAPQSKRSAQCLA